MYHNFDSQLQITVALRTCPALRAVGIASAQEWRVSVVDPEARTFAEQRNIIPNFPYHACADQSRTGAYSFAQNISFVGNNTYCFSLLVNNCSDPCCKTDLNKIEVPNGWTERLPGAASCQPALECERMNIRGDPCHLLTLISGMYGWSIALR